MADLRATIEMPAVSAITPPPVAVIPGSDGPARTDQHTRSGG